MSLEETQREFNTISYGMWRACAGKFVHLPKLNSMVYYFSQGHALQASSKVDLPSMLASRSGVLCRLSSITFLADPHYDEVLVKFGLEPLRGNVVESSGSNVNCDDDDDEDTGFVSYNKILTASDANNGGGFSVPRHCAETIFPKLNFADDPPKMIISISDLQGNAWEFKHIYCGTPRRHLFTTGWSKFVNAKNIISRDTVVFIRNKDMQMYVGLRRTFTDNRPWGEYNPGAEEPNERFSRVKRGRVPPREVIDAAENAVNGIPFEAVYYSRLGMTEFVVAADKVKAACEMCWSAGTRVKLSQETEDGLGETFLNGSVNAVIANDHCSWPGSSWGMLEVLWDEENKRLSKLQRVNPWQLHLVGPTPPLLSALPPLKKIKDVHSSGIHIHTQRDISLLSTGLCPMMDQSNRPPYVNFNTNVDGIQRTRHFLSSAPSFLTFPNPMECIDGVNNVAIDSASLDTSLADNSVPHLTVCSASSNTSLADTSSPHVGVDNATHDTSLADNSAPDTSLADTSVPHLATGTAFSNTSLGDTCSPHLGVDSATHDTPLADSSAPHLAGCSASPDTLVTDSQNSVLAIDGATAGQQTSNLPLNKRMTPVSFQLFGNTIYAEQPLTK